MTSSSTLEITFEGGTDTIGGNAVVLKAKKGGKLFQYLFDFGVSADRYQPQYTLSSEPDSIEEFRHRGLISDFDMNLRACFISHAHRDHCIALPALYASKYRPDAIWATKTTSRLIGRVQFVEKPLLTNPFEKKDYYEDPEAKEKGIDLKVALYPVDHDIPGACCFFTMIGESLIVYTGDFRDHGFLSGVLKRQFWEYAKKLQTKRKIQSCTVICEGTNFGLPFDFRPQRDFDQRMRDVFKRYANDLVSLVINRDGLWDLFSVLISGDAQKYPRKVVVSENLRDFLRKVRDSFLEDYKRAVTKSGFTSFQYLTDPIRFQVYEHGRRGSIDLLRVISQNPSKYLLFLTRYEAFDALEKISMLSGQAGGCCVLSFSGDDETSDSPIRTYAEALGHLGFCVEKTNALARGHVSPHNLMGILGCIKPTRIFVMHTLAPAGLKAFLESHLNCEIIAPSKGTPYNI